MSYINKSVSILGDEKTFIKAFINELTSADSRITCDTDIDAQFSDTANTPSFAVNFGTNYKMIFARKTDLNNTTDGYWCDTYIGDTKYVLDGGIYFCKTDVSATETAVRCFNAVVAANSNALYVALGNHDNAMPGNRKVSLLGTFNEELSIASWSPGNTVDILTNYYIAVNDENAGQTFTFTDRLNYSAKGGELEIIKNKALLSGGTKFCDISGLYDCSTFTKFLETGIEGKQYFSLNEHTLMPID